MASLGLGGALEASRTRPRPLRLGRGLSGDALLTLATIVVTGCFVLPPLVELFITSGQVVQGTRVVSGFSLRNYQDLLDLGGDTPTILLNTLAFGLGSSALGLLIGGSLAWLVERTNVGFGRLVYVAAFASFAIPGVVKVVGWILLLGPQSGLVNVLIRGGGDTTSGPINVFSLGGMVFVEGLLWTPVVFLLVAATLRGMDPHLEEAASTAGAGAWSVLWRITARLALPTIFSVLILTLIRSVESFETPALIGIPGHVEVLTTVVFEKVRGSIVPQYGQGSAYAVVLMVLVSALLVPYSRMTAQASRFATIGGKGFRPRVIELGAWRGVMRVLVLLLPALVLLPVAVLLWASILPFYQAPSATALASLTLENYQGVFKSSGIVGAVGNTLVVAITAAAAVCALSVAVAWVVVRTRVSGRWLVEHLASAPLVFPGIVLGIAVLRTFVSLPLPIYGTIWAIAFAYVARSIPYGVRFGEAGLMQINRELEESASASGAPFGQVLRRVVLPLMAPALAGAFVYVFLLSVKDLSVAVLLYGPKAPVISTTMFELWRQGQVTQLAAFSVVMTVLFVAVGLAFYQLSRRYGIQAV